MVSVLFLVVLVTLMFAAVIVIVNVFPKRRDGLLLGALALGTILFCASFSHVAAVVFMCAWLLAAIFLVGRYSWKPKIKGPKSSPFPCPPAERLNALLDGRLPQAEQARLNRHLEGCTACQHRMEGLVAGQEFWSGAARKLNQPHAPDGVLRQVMDQLKEEGEPVETSDLPNADHDLGFLSPPEKPGQLGRLGHYEVLEVIGRGGFGVVLKALDPSLQRVVAIKVLAPHLAANGTARRRFTREAQAAAAVSHDHVVTIHAVEEANGLPYLVMQYIAGQSLQQRLDESGPLELKEILRIGMQTAAGLAAAHAQGLVHRDIKPANILLENGVQRVKITDFGLARAADDASLTQSGFVAGTPQYMAPEQARGEALDHRADLFSLGSTLYAMATGRPPFRASSTLAVLRRVADETPRPVRELNPEIPAWLAAIIEKLHAKSPAQRFQSAAEVAELLEQHLAQLQQASSSRPAVVPLPKAPEPAPVPPPITSLTICPLCGCHLDIPEKLVGRQVTCPQCGKAFVVQEASEEIQIVGGLKSQRVPPARTRGRRTSGLWILLVLGGVFLLVCFVSCLGLVGWYTVSESPRPQAAQVVPQVDSAPMAAVLPQASQASLTAALDWFPPNASSLVALDVRALEPLNLDPEVITTALGVLFPTEVSLEAVHIDRIAVAYGSDAAGSGSYRLLRLTGKVDREQLTEAVRRAIPGVQVMNKDKPGEPAVREFRNDMASVALAVVGDTDLIVAGYTGGSGRAVEVLWHALDVRARQEPSARGSFYAVRDVAPDAVGFVLGQVPPGLAQELDRWKLPIQPQTIYLEARPMFDYPRSGQPTPRPRPALLSVCLEFQGYAPSFQQTLIRWKRLGLHTLEDLPTSNRLDPEVVKLLAQALESVRMFGTSFTMVDGRPIGGKVRPAGPPGEEGAYARPGAPAGARVAFSHLFGRMESAADRGPYQIMLEIPTKALPPLWEAWKAQRASAPEGPPTRAP